MVRATFGTVVIADLDNLKRVNDQHGHAVGDQLIRRCADVLRGALRPYDKLYRWGGDEFLLVLPVGARVQRAWTPSPSHRRRRSRPARLGRRRSRLQVSLGAADYASSEQLSTAIERADRAMYVEKERRKTKRAATAAP